MNVGERVVAIKSGIYIIKDKIYIIQGVKECCNIISIDVGVTRNCAGTHCDTCGAEWIGEDYFHSKYFRPLHYDTCHDELTTVVEERIDIEIEEPVEIKP